MKDYSEIELTEEEIKEAILEGKKRKYFKQKADLKEQEDGMHQLRQPENRKQRPDVVRNVQSAQEENNAGKAIGEGASDQETVGRHEANDGDIQAKGGKVSGRQKVRGVPRKEGNASAPYVHQINR